MIRSSPPVFYPSIRAELHDITKSDGHLKCRTSGSGWATEICCYEALRAIQISSEIYCRRPVVDRNQLGFNDHAAKIQNA